MGYNCEKWSTFKKSKRCRYCDVTIAYINLKLPEALRDICDEKECASKRANACNKI